MAVSAVWADAWTVAGHTYDDQATVGGEKLVLNGAGVASKYGLTFYTVGLYLKKPQREAQAVASDTGPKRLRIRMKWDVAAEEFGKALRDGVAKRAAPALQTQLAPRIERFNNQVKALGKLKNGDVIDLDYLPGKGMQLSLNNSPRGEAIEGADLYAAVLNIYLGEQALSPTLRASLLGSRS